MGSAFPSPLMPPSTDLQDRPKKPRHRHSPAQLAALNELYDKIEHPSLAQRSSLAEKLGMETKTVNAWFQNKRASTKKRTRAVAHPLDPPASSPLIASPSTSTTGTPQQGDLHDFPDELYPPLDHNASRHPSLLMSIKSPQQQTFFAGNPEHKHIFAESEPIPRRMRVRPSHEQTEELKKLYNLDPHPTREEREELGDRIGMRYQSITNWFQNQRSLAKKRKDEEGELPTLESPNEGSSVIEFPNDSRVFSAFPPPSNHPSFRPFSPTSHSSRGLPSRSRRSSSVSLPSAAAAATTDALPTSRRLTPTHRLTPYHNSRSPLVRPRRTRPEPYQLHALKRLFEQTSIPTIEQRTRIASEINMDVGKVTNWFRNLRQTARKRAKRIGNDDDDDEDALSLHNPYSPVGSPSMHSSSSSSGNEADDHMDLGEDYDMASDDEFQEAVTPSPETSPSPSPLTSTTMTHHRPSMGVSIKPTSYEDIEKARYSGIKVDDALLLLSFHQHGDH